jgi:hypothetical protein
VCGSAPQLESLTVCDSCNRHHFLGLRVRRPRRPLSPSPPPPKNVNSSASRARRAKAPVATAKRPAPHLGTTTSASAADGAAVQPPAKRRARRPAPKATAADCGGAQRAAVDALSDGRPFCARALPMAAWLPHVRRQKQRQQTQALGARVHEVRPPELTAQQSGGDVATVARSDWAKMHEGAQKLTLKLGRSCTAGFGLFATESIASGALVVEYVGQVRATGSAALYACVWLACTTRRAGASIQHSSELFTLETTLARAVCAARPRGRRRGAAPRGGPRRLPVPPARLGRRCHHRGRHGALHQPQLRAELRDHAAGGRGASALGHLRGAGDRGVGGAVLRLQGAVRVYNGAACAYASAVLEQPASVYAIFDRDTVWCGAAHEQSAHAHAPMLTSDTRGLSND